MGAEIKRNEGNPQAPIILSPFLYQGIDRKKEINGL